MGKRSGAETAGGILLAFRLRSQWRQPDLAREVDVTVETLLRALRSLSAQGMPLRRDDSDKPHVWWRVPKDWVPSGVLFSRDQTPALLRVLGRSPRTRERDQLLGHAARSARADGAPNRVEPPSLSDLEEAWLTVVENAATRGVALNMRYFSASRGKTESRFVSVQRVLVGPPSRFVAACHRSGALKWFRVENVLHAKLDAGTPYRRNEESKVLTFVSESVDGYRGEGEPIACSFVVREPEAQWVRLNLLPGMKIDPDDNLREGVRVLCSTPGVLRVARFVAGMGGAARVDTLELAACVREIAKGALGGADAGAKRDSHRDHGKNKRVGVQHVEG